jgi:hypothetical protein
LGAFTSIDFVFGALGILARALLWLRSGLHMNVPYGEALARLDEDGWLVPWPEDDDVNAATAGESGLILGCTKGLLSSSTASDGKAALSWTVRTFVKSLRYLRRQFLSCFEVESPRTTQD